jgi:hypothetical protein
MFSFLEPQCNTEVKNRSFSQIQTNQSWHDVYVFEDYLEVGCACQIRLSENVFRRAFDDPALYRSRLWIRRPAGLRLFRLRCVPERRRVLQADTRVYT